MNCFVTSTPPPLGVSWWTQLGTKDGIPYQCARLNLETAQLHAKVNVALAEAISNPGDTDNIVEVAAMAIDLELKFQVWENNIPSAWKFTSAAWIDPIDEDQLEHSPCFPGRVDEYTDISVATAWNMVRAHRIMLGASIVRTSSWLLPRDQDYHITPEYISTARVSQELIEDIIASVPTFLGNMPATGRTPTIERENLGGKCALALFIMWPLFIVTISDHTTDEQRKWALGRLRFIADEEGIHQASFFTQVRLSTPLQINR